MNETKPWYLSKAVVGGVVAAAAGIAALAGIAVSPEDQVVITDAVIAIAGSVGGLLAVYGRVKASKKIG